MTAVVSWAARMMVLLAKACGSSTLSDGGVAPLGCLSVVVTLRSVRPDVTLAWVDLWTHAGEDFPRSLVSRR